jgi:hypothetical protein
VVTNENLNISRTVKGQVIYHLSGFCSDIVFGLSMSDKSNIVARKSDARFNSSIQYTHNPANLENQHVVGWLGVIDSEASVVTSSISRPIE